MKTIWKYPIKTTDMQQIEMPVGAEILTVQTQDGLPMLWALVDPEGIEKEVFIIETIGTGNPCNHGPREYIGTYQQRGGLLIWHVFKYLGL